MGKEVIEEVRYFLEAASKQFEKKGIYLQRVRFERDEEGVCQYAELSYEDRNKDNNQTNREEIKQ